MPETTYVTFEEARARDADGPRARFGVRTVNRPARAARETSLLFTSVQPVGA
ncbi:hypothetical protein ACWGA0_19120 [Streptomyces erythrochromogenes]